MSFRLPPSQLCRHYTQHVGRALCLEQTRLTRCKLKNSTESTTNVDCQFGSRSLQTLRRNNTCLHVAKNLLSGRHRLPQWHDFAQADTWSPCRGMQKTKRGSGPRGAPRAVSSSGLPGLQKIEPLEHKGAIVSTKPCSVPFRILFIDGNQRIVSFSSTTEVGIWRAD